MLLVMAAALVCMMAAVASAAVPREVKQEANRAEAALCDEWNEYALSARCLGGGRTTCRTVMAANGGVIAGRYKCKLRLRLRGGSCWGRVTVLTDPLRQRGRVLRTCIL